MPKEGGAEEAAFRERVRDAIQLGGKSGEMSRKTGIPVGTLNKYVSLRSSPSGLNAAKIAIAVGKTVEELSGLNPTHKNPQLGSLSRLATDSEPQNVVLEESGANPNLISIPAYDGIRPAAGAGAFAFSEQPTSVVAFDRRWLRDLGINPVSAKILFADGDSMYPTIRDGAPMLVDTSKTEIRHGCIYVFDLDGDLMVKRIERLPDGTIDLISDNREIYPVRNISRDRLDLLHVIGRVFLTIRTF